MNAKQWYQRRVAITAGGTTVYIINFIIIKKTLVIMFFRRLMRSDSGMKTEGPPPGMQSMDIALQNRFAKGVNYNMKIVIKGDRNVGKTCLFSRLQGHKFREEYIPTDEIQVASINWNYKTSDDVIKVEIWDVVDKGRKKRKIGGLKLDTNQSCEDLCLDGDLIDVYKGTNGVIIIFDITKQWTFDYVVREVEKIPSSLPLLLLGNHRDMGHHRTVTDLQAHALQEQLQTVRDTPVRYTPCSMRNGFGLKFIHKFFNIPFLHLQKSCLVRQLETNGEEMLTTLDELNMLQQSKDHSYEHFLGHHQHHLSKGQDSSSNNLSQKKHLSDHSGKDAKAEAESTTASVTNIGYAMEISSSILMPSLSNKQNEKQTELLSKNIANKQTNLKDRNSINNPSSPKPMNISSQNSQDAKNLNADLVVRQTSFGSVLASVDDFQPDDETLDLKFLELDYKTGEDLAPNHAMNTNNSDSSDDEKTNPLVQRLDNGDVDDDNLGIQSNSNHIHIQGTFNIQNKRTINDVDSKSPLTDKKKVIDIRVIGREEQISDVNIKSSIYPIQSQGFQMTNKYSSGFNDSLHVDNQSHDSNLNSSNTEISDSGGALILNVDDFNVLEQCYNNNNNKVEDDDVQEPQHKHKKHKKQKNGSSKKPKSKNKKNEDISSSYQPL